MISIAQSVAISIAVGISANGGGGEVPMSQTNLLDLGLSSTDIDARLNYFAALDPVPIGVVFDFRGNGLPTAASADARYILTLDDRNEIMVG